MSKMQQKFDLYVDMDGVLCSYMSATIKEMTDSLEKVVADINLYKTKHTDFYKAAKKAVYEQGGNLDEKNLGEPFLPEHVNRETTRKFVRNFMYKCVFNNYPFWRDMPWMPGGKELWDFVKGHNPTILSGPQGPNSKIGKVDWVRRELGLGKDRVILTQTKHEEALRSLKNGKIAILIDDMQKYIVPFRNAGGIAIEHIETAETIEALKELGF